MSIVNLERAINVALAPLMGDVADGAMLVRSLSGNAILRVRDFCVPIGDGDFFEPDAAVFVRKNPASADGSWVITEAGTMVAVEAMQGGPVANRPAGSQYRWFPEVPNVEPISVSPDGISGGVASDKVGSIRQLRSFKAMEANDWLSFYRAQLGQFPGAALCWEALRPLDGPGFASPGPRNARMGSGKMKYKHLWNLFLVTSRQDAESLRRNEAQILMMNVVNELNQRTGTRDGMWRLSVNPGIQVINAGIVNTYPESHVDNVQFECVVTLKQETRAVANPWLTTRIVATKPNEDPADNRPPLTTADVSFSMADDDEDEDD